MESIRMSSRLVKAFLRKSSNPCNSVSQDFRNTPPNNLSFTNRADFSFTGVLNAYCLIFIDAKVRKIGRKVRKRPVKAKGQSARNIPSKRLDINSRLEFIHLSLEKKWKTDFFEESRKTLQAKWKYNESQPRISISFIVYLCSDRWAFSYFDMYQLCFECIFEILAQLCCTGFNCFWLPFLYYFFVTVVFI